MAMATIIPIWSLSESESFIPLDATSTIEISNAAMTESRIPVFLSILFALYLLRYENILLLHSEKLPSF